MSAAFHFAYRIFSSFYEFVSAKGKLIEGQGRTYRFRHLSLGKSFQDFKKVGRSKELFGGRPAKILREFRLRGWHVCVTYLVAPPLRSSLSAMVKTRNAKSSTYAALADSMSIASFGPISSFSFSRKPRRSRRKVRDEDSLALSEIPTWAA